MNLKVSRNLYKCTRENLVGEVDEGEVGSKSTVSSMEGLYKEWSQEPTVTLRPFGSALVLEFDLRCFFFLFFFLEKKMIVLVKW